jgi:hypothetical protein
VELRSEAAAAWRREAAIGVYAPPLEGRRREEVASWRVVALVGVGAADGSKESGREGKR